MPLGRRDSGPDAENLESIDREERQMIDSLIDDMGAQSFPASDPPAWGVVSSRLEETDPRLTPPSETTLSS
jgi:hypothetical protein